jgi:L-rhamnose isomerase / sugar isomerase
MSFMQVRKRATRTHGDHDRAHRCRQSGINLALVSPSGSDLEHIGDHRIDVEAVVAGLGELKIETPSWGYGNSGTRFGVFPWPGAARTVHERIADAALVHRLTGASPTVAIHVIWDWVDNWDDLAAFAESEGVRLGAINGNVFQGDDYRLGSFCHPEARVRRIAIDHCLECIEIAKQVNSDVFTVWLADGTNYPGQDDMRERYRRLLEGFGELYAALPPEMRFLVEYKFFEPAFYSTDLPDWGTAVLVCRALGPQTQVLVDTGHHPLGTNVEQIVALLLEEGLLGGFHFNSRKYADDDLIVGSLDPFELFRIMSEIVSAKRDPATATTANAIEFMVDQSHNIEGKIEAMIQSVINIQTAYAKALLVDRDALQQAQTAGDVLRAHRVLTDAYETDVRPLLVASREANGLPLDPVEAFREGGHAERLARERA